MPPAKSEGAIRAALKVGGNENVTVKLYPAADHTFTIVDPKPKGGWPVHVPDYADVLVAWVRQQIP